MPRPPAIALLAFGLFACSGDPAGNTDEDPCGNAIGNGATIIAGPSAPGGSDHDSVFRSVVIDPTDSRTIFIGTERNGIVRSRDGGLTWDRVRSGLRHANQIGYPEVFELAISQSNPSLLVAATTDSPGPITGDFPSTIGGVYRSTDGGTTWERANCGLSNASIGSVSFGDSGPSTVVIAVSAGRASFTPLTGQFFAGGLYRSTDGGRQWSVAAAPNGAELNEFTIRSARASGSLIAFGLNRENVTSSLGFLRSLDSGASWTPLQDGLSGRDIPHFDISSDGQTIYADAGNAFTMFRSRDGGVSWTEVPANSNGPMAVSPTDPNVLIYDANGTLRRTADGLETWDVVIPSARRFQDIEFAPNDPNVVYAVTQGYDVYGSQDGGLTFTLLVNLRATVLN